MGGSEFIDPACIIKARNTVQMGLELQTGGRLLVKSSYWGTWKHQTLVGAHQLVRLRFQTAICQIPCFIE